ncbi:MAG: hypothetical protein E7013_00835 [Alphaproteobacteria bacterium]|nr:hypothetical protein [Alphaproteobacteria bacterium]
MATKDSLFYDLITGENKTQLNLEKQATLLKQQENIKEYKKKLGSYRANMASQGAGANLSSVLDGLAQDVEIKNSLATNQLNQKIRNANRTRRKQTLLNLGLKS